MKRTKSGGGQRGSNIDKKKIPHEITFLTYQQEIQQLDRQKKVDQTIGVNQIPEPTSIADSFAPDERQNLKNAFRYICRLCFKESRHYQHSILALLQSNSLPISNSQLSQKLTTLTHDAETISGQRYFKHYLQSLEATDQIIILQYMLWFLKYKYLRYIKNSNTERGKRKAMKKDLYLRFKNQIMMPYLQNLLVIKRS